MLPVERKRRFSQLYLERGAPERDSARMRTRLGAAVPDLDASWDFLASERIKAELGISTSKITISGGWVAFFKSIELRDVLDTVTIVFSLLRRTRGPYADNFLNNVARIFAEENVGYRVDDVGVVHFAVDADFEQGRSSTIRALEDARYVSVAGNFQNAFIHLDQVPPDGRAAIRSTFGALEALFKLMFDRAPRLGGKELDQHLKPKLDTLYAPGSAHGRAVSRLLASFKEWVEAAHHYRHEPSGGDDSQPPLDLVVLMVSGGASYLRWLAEVDHQLIAQQGI